VPHELNRRLPFSNRFSRFLYRNRAATLVVLAFVCLGLSGLRGSTLATDQPRFIDGAVESSSGGFCIEK